MLTYILIAVAAVVVVAVVVHEIRSWRRPGRHITLNAPMDDSKNARAKFQHEATQASQRAGGSPL